MRLKDKYPYLFRFFAGYFHQDWNDDYATAADGVRDFLTATRPEIAKVATELKAFLNEFQDDAELRKSMIELGNEYAPSRDQLTHRGWLACNEVLPIIEKHLADNKGQTAKSA